MFLDCIKIKFRRILGHFYNSKILRFCIFLSTKKKKISIVYFHLHKKVVLSEYGNLQRFQVLIGNIDIQSLSKYEKYQCTQSFLALKTSLNLPLREKSNFRVTKNWWKKTEGIIVSLLFECFR